ncbi:MAG TPA: hypothetical protein VJ787_09170, partial [Thermoleophilia bacterium]|nr:hypothetical protein [Thermoleophilia bacterium]
QQTQEAAAERAFRAAVIDKAVENATVVLPSAMVDRQVEALYHELGHTVSDRGITMEDYLTALGRTPEQVHEELRPRAEATLRRGLVIEAVREAEGLEVSDDEVRERIKRDAVILQRDPNQLVIDAYASGRQEMVRDELLIAKAVDFLVEHAVAIEAEPAAEADDEAEAAIEIEEETEPAGEVDEVKPVVEVDEAEPAIDGEEVVEAGNEVEDIVDPAAESDAETGAEAGVDNAAPDGKVT